MSVLSFLLCGRCAEKLLVSAGGQSCSPSGCRPGFDLMETTAEENVRKIRSESIPSNVAQAATGRSAAAAAVVRRMMAARGRRLSDNAALGDLVRRFLGKAVSNLDQIRLVGAR